jgi:hypothetical protein
LPSGTPAAVSPAALDAGLSHVDLPAYAGGRVGGWRARQKWPRCIEQAGYIGRQLGCTRHAEGERRNRTCRACLREDRAKRQHGDARAAQPGLAQQQHRRLRQRGRQVLSQAGPRITAGQLRDRDFGRRHAAAPGRTRQLLDPWCYRARARDLQGHQLGRQAHTADRRQRWRVGVLAQVAQRAGRAGPYNPHAPGQRRNLRRLGCAGARSRQLHQRHAGQAHADQEHTRDILHCAH